MGSSDKLEWGTWNVICDRCGFKRKANEVKKTWNNLIVCADTCFETRHPQDFVRSTLDTQRVEFTRPDHDINVDGTPVVDGSATFNCSVQEYMWIPSVINASQIVAKALAKGPLIITSGTLTVLCNLEIR